MIIDQLPLHWGLIFQLTTLITVFLVLYQIATARKLDAMRRHDISRGVFHARRTALVVMLLALLWTVIYAHGNGWQPWPPIVLFLLAYDVQVITHVIVMRCDIRRLAPMFERRRI